MAQEPIQPDDSLPGQLADDLGVLYRRDIPSSQPFDAETLGLARSAFGRNRRHRRILPWAAFAAVAASIVVALVTLRPASQVALGPAPNSGDKVTILDAYRLAKTLSAGGQPSKDWNRTGDAVATQADVDAWARAAVQLPEGRQ